MISPNVKMAKNGLLVKIAQLAVMMEFPLEKLWTPSCTLPAHHPFLIPFSPRILTGVMVFPGKSHHNSQNDNGVMIGL